MLGRLAKEANWLPRYNCTLCSIFYFTMSGVDLLLSDTWNPEIDRSCCGSKNMFYDSSNLTTPDILWLGIRPIDFEKYNILEKCLFNPNQSIFGFHVSKSNRSTPGHCKVEDWANGNPSHKIHHGRLGHFFWDTLSLLWISSLHTRIGSHYSEKEYYHLVLKQPIHHA